MRPFIRKNEAPAADKVEDAAAREILRLSVRRHLAICDGIRNGTMDICFIGLDQETGAVQAVVTAEDVDQTEAIIRNAFGNIFPDLIGRQPQTPPTPEA